MVFGTLIAELSNYFGIKELVDERTFNRWGDRSWRYFDRDLLLTLLFIREELNRPITINNWSFKNPGPVIFVERGLRTNVCPIVKGRTEKDDLYLSAHVLGKAIDFDVKGMTAEEVRNWLIKNKDRLPCKIRLEHKKDGEPINWVHLDVYWEGKNSKVYLFDI